MAGPNKEPNAETPAASEIQAESPLRSVIDRLMEQNGHKVNPVDAGEVVEEAPESHEEDQDSPEAEEQELSQEQETEPEEDSEFDLEAFWKEPEADLDDQEDTNSWPEGTPEWVPKRIGREKEKAEKWRAKAEELEQRSQELEARLSQQNSEILGDDVTEESLAEKERSAKSVLKKAKKWDRMLARGRQDEVAEEIQEIFGKEVSDPDSFVDSMVERAEETIEKIPSQRRAIQSVKAIEAQASQTFPWLRDQNSPIRKEYDSLLLKQPLLKKIPEHPMLLGLALLGSQVMQSHNKKAKTTKAPGGVPRTPPPKAPTGTSSTPSPKPAGKQAKLEEQKRRAIEGDDKDVKNFFGAYAQSKMQK